MKANLKNMIFLILAALASKALAVNQLSGICVGPDGQPAAGLSLALTGSQGTLQGNTAADGSYSFVGLADETYSLSAFGSGLNSNPALAALAGGISLHLDLKLYSTTDPSLVSKSLIFVCQVNQAPLAGVAVTLCGPSGSTAAVADSNGQVNFPGLLPGSYLISVVGNGYGPASTTADLQASRSPLTIAVQPGSPSSLGLVAGMNMNNQGAALAGTQVTAAGTFGSLTTSAAGDGSFAFAGLPGGLATLTFQNAQGSQTLPVYVPAQGAAYVSLEFTPVNGTTAQSLSPAGSGAAPSLAWVRTQGGAAVLFQAATGSQNLNVDVFSLDGRRICQAGAVDGRTSQLNSGSMGQGIYLARASYRDAAGRSIQLTKKFAIY